MVTCYDDESLFRMLLCKLNCNLDCLIECKCVIDVCKCIVSVACPVDLSGLNHHEETSLVVEDIDSLSDEILKLKLIIFCIKSIHHCTVILENRAVCIYLSAIGVEAEDGVTIIRYKISIVLENLVD